MAKIINFNQLYLPLDYNFSEKIYNQFLNSELGRLYQTIPWDILVRFYRQRERHQKAKPGRPRKYSVRTELAILILQTWTGWSMKRLLEAISQNIYYQIFCQMIYVPGDIDREYYSLYQLHRRYQLSLEEIKALQKELAKEWLPFLIEKDGFAIDATVFMSNINWPVVIRLLDKSLQELEKMRQAYARVLGSRLSSKRLEKLHNRFLYLIKQRKKKKKTYQKLVKLQLGLMGEYIKKIENQIERLREKGVEIKPKFQQRLRTIKQVYEEQLRSLSGEKISHPIVSLYKDYIRGIYRGKQKVSKEYGLKFHILLQGGLGFIEYYSHENFNETRRFESSITYSYSLFGNIALYLSADKIYWSKNNRKIAQDLGIKTNFKPIGRPRKGEQGEQGEYLRIELNRGRNQIEGLFGVLKQQYYTEYVRYKPQSSLVLMVFLGLLIYNSLKIYRNKKILEQYNPKSA